MEEQNDHRLLKNLRKSRAWIYLISLTGLLFIGFMFWKVVINDPWFSRRGLIVHIVVYGLTALGIFRYMLFLRQQASLSNNNGRTDREKMDKYYQRGFYFWLMEALMTITALCLFLYALYNRF